MPKFAVAATNETRRINLIIVQADGWLDALDKAGFGDEDTLEAWRQDGHCQDAARGQAQDDDWDFCVMEIK